MCRALITCVAFAIAAPLVWADVTPGLGSVAIYTGETQWIGKAEADTQASITNDGLNAAGINTSWFDDVGQIDQVATWVASSTNNGALDVLILYGDIPTSVYEGDNAQADGSLAEMMVESPDGDAIINHADYMFWGIGGRNSEGGIQNIMDIPDIVMWDDNTAVEVTTMGATISPTLAGLSPLETDRPFHVDQLAGGWTAEIVLAENADGTRADPIIVRDGTAGRLIPVIQTNGGGEPHGQIDIELISWMMGNFATAVEPQGKATVTWGSLKNAR
jgi:hypothetical protein